MQEIREYGIGWDEQLPTELKNKWETWCSQVCLLNDLTLERKYFPYPLDKGKDLHIFCYASPRAFEAVAFSSTSFVQVTAPLPALRVEQSAPFSVFGIDFGGPLYTKDENKHYIVLFTCAVTRALHLELVNNLTTETFLLALRRFISRRGLYSKNLTDNANTFKKSELELKNLWKIISDPTVKASYASHKIYWQFIIERAPWWGGFYERLIRTVKLALRKIVGRATLFRDELDTLLIEIEGVLNSRPLTCIFSEFNEPEPLTPSMILGRTVNNLPPARLCFDSNLSNRKVLIKRFNYRERLLNMFWTKWSKEYICMLKSAHCVKPTGKIKEFKIEENVLIKDEKISYTFLETR
ncbi:integrase catalytic domain-containing protein [Trichonephila clavipes]|nr:integrase catalytic domain-containing protein [Trichonephila clavipes]